MQFLSLCSSLSHPHPPGSHAPLSTVESLAFLTPTRPHLIYQHSYPITLLVHPAPIAFSFCLRNVRVPPPRIPHHLQGILFHIAAPAFVLLIHWDAISVFRTVFSQAMPVWHAGKFGLAPFINGLPLPESRVEKFGVTFRGSKTTLLPIIAPSSNGMASSFGCEIGRRI